LTTGAGGADFAECLEELDEAARLLRRELDTQP
jgi:hypothetical protein